MKKEHNTSGGSRKTVREGCEKEAELNMAWPREEPGVSPAEATCWRVSWTRVAGGWRGWLGQWPGG